MNEPTETRWPTFVVGGAPKSGTTALATYLREHPLVFFSEPKEPFFWADDMPLMRAGSRCTTLQEYQRLFRKAGSEHVAVGEGSTLYLYSDSAVRNLCEQIPDIRLVFMIRNPVEIAHAYHMQMVFHEMEDEKDFERAWELQSERKSGSRVPEKCTEPKLLQYYDLACVGTQVERAVDLAGRDRVLLILFDDFKADTRGQYLRVLEFLGVPDDGRDEFPRVNPAMKARFGSLTRLKRSGPADALTRALKNVLTGRAFALARSVRHFLFLKRVDRDPIPPEFLATLKAEFAKEVSILERLFGRDLSHWQ